MDALQVIQELITIAEDLREETNDDLPEEERGFYDALARIDTAREARSNKLRTIIAELVTTSRMCVAVKRIVRKHGWPPDL